MEYAVVDKSKKKKKDDNQQKVHVYVIRSWTFLYYIRSYIANVFFVHCY